MEPSGALLSDIRLKKDKQRKIVFLSIAVLTCLMFCNFAYAGVLENVVEFIESPVTKSFSVLITFLVNLLAKGIAGLLALISAPILKMMEYDTAELAGIIPIGKDGMGSGGLVTKFNAGIKTVAVLIWVLLSIFAILFNFYYIASGNKKAVQPLHLFTSITVSGVLTFIGQNLMFALFDNIIQPLTSSFISDTWNLNTFAGSFWNSMCQDFLDAYVDDALLGCTIVIIMLVIIGINYVKLALEMVQRYVIVAIICALSPMAFAAGCNQETAEISKKWFRMFWSQGVLLFLNVWCIAVAITGICNIGGEDILIKALIVYGFIKVAQQLDDMLKNAGLDITSQTGGLLEDMLAAGKTISSAAGAIGDGLAYHRDMKSLREGLATGKNTMDDVKKRTQEFASKHPMAAATMTPYLASQMGASKMTAMDYQDSVKKYLHADSNARKDMKPVDFKNSKAAQQVLKKELENSKNPRIADLAKNGELQNAYVDKNGTLHATFAERDANGNIKSITGVAVSGNGKESMSNIDSFTQFGADKDGTPIVANKDTGLFKYDEKTGEFVQVADKDGKALEDGVEPMRFAVPDYVNANDPGELGDYITQKGGFEELAKQSEEAKDFAAASNEDRKGADLRNVDEGQLNNAVRNEMRDSGIDVPADGSMQVALNKDSGELSAAVETKNEDGSTSVQNYKKDADGQWRADGLAETYSAVGDNPAFTTKDGRVFVGQTVGETENGNVVRYSERDSDGNIVANGQTFEQLQSKDLTPEENAKLAANSNAMAASSAEINSASMAIQRGDEKFNYNSQAAKSAAQTMIAPEAGEVSSVSRTTDGNVEIKSQLPPTKSGMTGQVTTTIDSQTGEKTSTMTWTSLPNSKNNEVDVCTRDVSGGDYSRLRSFDGEKIKASVDTNNIDPSSDTVPVKVQERAHKGADGNVVKPENDAVYTIQAPRSVVNDNAALAEYMKNDGMQEVAKAKESYDRTFESMSRTPNQNMAGQHVDSNAASSVASKAVMDGNCDNAELVQAMRKGQVTQVAANNEFSEDGTLKAAFNYYSPSNGMYVQANTHLEGTGDNVKCVSDSVPTVTQSPEEIRNDVRSFANTMTDAKASMDDQSAALDFATRPGATRNNFHTEIASEEMRKACGIPDSAGKGYNVPIDYMEETGLVANEQHKDIPLSEDDRRSYSSAEVLSLAEGSTGTMPTINPDKNLVVKYGNDGKSAAITVGDQTFYILNHNEKTGQCEIRSAEEGSESKQMNIGKGKSLQDYVRGTLRSRANRADEPEERSFENIFGDDIKRNNPDHEDKDAAAKPKKNKNRNKNQKKK